MVEREVEELYRMAGAAPDDVWRPSKVCRKILGQKSIRVVPGLYELGRLVDWQLVEVRDGLPLAIAEWIIGHELGHLVRRSPHGKRREELKCDRIGAGIQMRRGVFVQRAKELNGNIRQLAFDFDVSETSVALRLGETQGRPIGVVTPQRIYTRGALEKVAPETLKAWLESGHPAIRRAALSDAPERVLIELLSA